jgi:hypothetical protein
MPKYPCLSVFIPSIRVFRPVKQTPAKNREKGQAFLYRRLFFLLLVRMVIKSKVAKD